MCVACVYVFVCMYVGLGSVFVQTCVYECEGSLWCQVSSPTTVHLMFWGRFSHWAEILDSCRLAGHLVPGILSATQSWDSRHVLKHLIFLYGCLDSNLHPSAFIPALQSSTFKYFYGEFIVRKENSIHNPCGRYREMYIYIYTYIWISLSTCILHFKNIIYIAHFNLKALQKQHHFTSKTILIVADKMCAHMWMIRYTGNIWLSQDWGNWVVRIGL